MKGIMRQELAIKIIKDTAEGDEKVINISLKYYEMFVSIHHVLRFSWSFENRN